MKMLQKLGFMIQFFYVIGMLPLLAIQQVDWLGVDTTTGKIIALSVVIVLSAVAGHYCWASLIKKTRL